MQGGARLEAGQVRYNTIMGFILLLFALLAPSLQYAAGASCKLIQLHVPAGAQALAGIGALPGPPPASEDRRNTGSSAGAVPTGEDVFRGDERLAGCRTIKMHDAPVTDLLADLGMQTSIRFFVDEAISQDRISLYAYNRPLSAILQALAHCCNYEWRRSGNGPDYAYTIGRSRRALQRDAELRLRVQQATAEEILQEAAEAVRLRTLPADVRRSEANRILGQMAAVTDAAVRRDLTRRYQLALVGTGDPAGRDLVLEVLRLLGRDVLLRVLEKNDGELSYPARGQSTPVPSDVVAAAVREAAPGRSVRSLNIFSRCSRGPAYSLHWDLVMEAGGAPMGFTGDLPLCTVDADTDAQLPPRAPLPSSFNDTITVMIQSLVARPSARGPAFAYRPRLGDALDALERVHPMDLVSDAFIASRLTPVGSVTLPVSSLLDHLANLSGHHWWYEDGFVMFRARDYEAVRAADPPADAFARWLQAAEGDGLGLDDYAQMASLTDAQWTTLQELAARWDFPVQLAGVLQARAHLRLWHALDRRLRRDALSQGVTRAQMTPAQRALMDAAAASGNGEVWRIRVTAYSKRTWAVRLGEGGLIADAGSRDEALHLFQRRDASVQAKDVRMVVFSVYGFTYEARDGAVVAHYFVDLPPRWEDAPAGS